MVRPAEAPRRPVEGTPIQFETIRREYSPPVTRARNRLRSQRTRVSTQPVTEVIRNRAVSRQIYHNMHIVRTPNNIEHNSMVLRSQVVHMDQLEQHDVMRQAPPTDGTQTRRKAKPRGIFTNAQKRRAQQSQCPIGSFNSRTLHPKPSLLNITQGPQPGPSTVPACDESRGVHTMVSRTRSGGFWRPDLSTRSSSSSLDEAATEKQTTPSLMGAASSQKGEHMLTSNVKAEVRAQAEKRRALLVRKTDSSESSSCSSKDTDKGGSTRLPLERDTPDHSSSSSEQSSDVTTTTSESDIDFSVLHRPSDLSLSELPEHGPVRGEPHTRRWYKSLGKGPRPWSSSSESTDEGKASSEASFRSISSVGSNSSHQSNDLNLPLINACNHTLPRNMEENNTAAEESTSGMQTKCCDSMVEDKSNKDLQTRSQGLALSESNACLHIGSKSTEACNTVAGGNNQDMQIKMNQNTQATDVASFVSSQSMKRKDCDDMRVHDRKNGTKKKKIEIKWKRPPPNPQHLDSHGSDSEMIKQNCQPSTSKVPSRTLTDLASKNRSYISSDEREDESIDNSIRAAISEDSRKKDAESRNNISVNNTAKDGDTREKEDAKGHHNILDNNTAKDGYTRSKEDAESSDNIWVNNTSKDGDMSDKKDAESRDNIWINNTPKDGAMSADEDAEKSHDNLWINNTSKDGDTRDKEDAKRSRDSILINNISTDGDTRDKEDAERSRNNIWVNSTAKDGDINDKEDFERSDNMWVNNSAMDGDNHVMKSESDEGWVYIIIDNSIGIHTASREKSIGEMIQDLQKQSRINRWANREASVPSNSFESPSRKRKLDFAISSETKKKKVEVKWKQPSSHTQHLELKIPADESKRQCDLPSPSTMPCPEQVAKVVEESISFATSRNEVAYNTRSAVKRKRGSEKDAGEGNGEGIDGGGKRRRC